MTSAVPAVPTIELRHGATIPQLGFGTYPLDDAEAERAVGHALQVGYRLIDTAENYRNETGVGRAVRDAGVPRGEIFLTTKLNRRWHGRDLVRQAFEASASRLGVDYLDLLLVHWPNPDQDRYVEAVQGLSDLLEEGLVRAIGTSNFKPAHLHRVIQETGVVPDVNQIQLSPVWTRPGSREFHAAHGIATESWSPLGRGTDLLDEPVLAEIAARHGKTPAQVVLRWHLELGLVVIPKTSSPERAVENLDVLDIALSAEEVERISALDRGEADVADSDSFGH